MGNTKKPYKHLCALMLMCIVHVSMFGGGTPDPGTTNNSRDNQLLSIWTNRNTANGGDFVNAIPTASWGALNSDWLFYIEVPPGQTNLTLQVFDADIREKDDADEYHDTSDNNSAQFSIARYQLYNPQGVLVATADIGQDISFNNIWATLNSNFSVANPIPGHWQVRVDMFDTQIPSPSNLISHNVYGLRAHDGNSGTGGTEYNMYSPTYVSTGHGEDTPTINPGSEDQNYYPYVTNDCAIDVNDYDHDFNGSYTVSARSGASVGTSSALSGNGLWTQKSFDSWATDASATEYGLWSVFFDGENLTGPGTVGQNFGVLYFGSEIASDPQTGDPTPSEPNASPESDVFRVYLPADGSNYANSSGTIIAPTKPYITHEYSIGASNVVTVTVNIVNPARPNGSAALPIEFSTATADQRVYSATASDISGSLTLLPAMTTTTTGTASITGTGPYNVRWAPGTVAGNSTATLTYSFSVTANTIATPQDFITNSRGVYIDQTCAGAGCTGTQLANATFTFGDLCDLRIIPNTLALPVELVHFSANRQGNNVELGWETASEQNNDKFVLEYSFDGKRYSPFAEIKGNGTTSHLSEYNHVHKDASKLGASNLYYRLKQVDFDGVSSYSDVKIVEFEREVSNVRLQPNPVRSGSLINVVGKNIHSVSIYSWDGRLVSTETFSDENEIRTLRSDGLLPGLYFMMINDRQEVKRLVVQ